MARKKKDILGMSKLNDVHDCERECFKYMVQVKKHLFIEYEWQKKKSLFS